MSVLERLFDTRPTTIRITKQEYIARTATSTLHYLYLKYWKLSTQSQRLRMLLFTSLTALSIYVISPTISWYLKSEEERKRMFSSKRLDKYTTGLINTRNDCFANSAIQAFASLPGLTVYLNEIHKQHKLVKSLPLPHHDDGIPELPLHGALADIVGQLQEPLLTARYVSVWPFLQIIEKIFNSRISTNQNDAQELVQLILETLGNERTKLKKFVRLHSLNVMIAELPFDGLLADQLTCYSCLNSSKPSFHPFSVLSLATPQERTTTLVNMLKSNEMETINGYHCLRCKVKAILKVEDQKLTNGIQLEEGEAQIVSRLKILESNLTINDDLEEPLESFVKNYEFEGFSTDKLLSTIVKKTIVVKPPSLLTVHLSRSMFTANHITRNGCNVTFGEVLDINVDNELAKEYETRKKAVRKPNARPLVNGDPYIAETEQDRANEDLQDNGIDEVEGYDDDRRDPNQLKKIHSKILTEHTEESVHYEEQDEEEEEEDAPRTLSTEESLNSKNSDGDSVAGSITSDEAQMDEEEEDEDNLSEELNFTRGNARYRLRAMIRHQGTHNAGHYECYRHKPNLMKDSNSGIIVDLSPQIKRDEEHTTPEETTPESPEATLQQPKPHTGAVSVESSSRGSETAESDEDGSHFTRFRSRLGSLVSRRSSTNSSPVSTSIRRNSSFTGHTPVNDLSESLAQLKLNSDDYSRKTSKYKKLSTVTKYPFWRISDSTISEVKKNDVLNERRSVYMIYYELINDE